MKRYFFLIAFLLAAEVMFGQLAFGLKGGYNASRLSTDLDSLTSSYGSGFHLGAFVRIGKKFFVQPEAYYTLQTSKFSGLTNLDEKITIGSVDIPVLAGFRFFDAKAVKVRIMAGPLVSFVINRNIKDLSDDPDALQLKQGDINNVNWAIQAGAGLDVSFLSLDVRYQAGLNNVIKEVQTLTLDSKNNAWVISLGFKLL
jgi:hypothetical protein